MSDVVFDKQDQLARVQEALLPGEKLYMVLDCKGRGSGFLAVTDLRVIVRDDGFARFKKTMVSIPFAHIHSVGLESDRGWIKGSSSLAFAAGNDDWELEFRGADKARAAYQQVMTGVLAASPPRP